MLHKNDAQTLAAVSFAEWDDRSCRYEECRILTIKETSSPLKTSRRQVRKMIANEDPPAFWSVGCLKGKSELFRLRFVLFAAVRSADFPLFPSSPARFFRILGQKWVRGSNIRRGLASCNLAPQSTLSILIPQMA